MALGMFLLDGLDGSVFFWKTTQIRINKKEINFDFSVNE